MNKRLGIIKLSYEDIGILLGLPENYKVDDVIYGSKDREEKTVKVVIDGYGLIETLPGCAICYLGPSYEAGWFQELRKKLTNVKVCVCPTCKKLGISGWNCPIHGDVNL